MALTEAEVKTYYEAILQREPTDAQLAVAMATGTADSLIDALIGSSEAASFVFPLIQVYQAVFGRVPDAAGLDFWVDAYRAGTSLETITEGFVASDEFQTMYGGVTDGSDPAFIQALYLNVLGRPGEPAGIAFWTSQTGISPAEVVRLFATDVEFTNKAEPFISQFLTNAANEVPGTYEGDLFAIDIPGDIGETFTLTTTVETIDGTADNDIINGLLNDDGTTDLSTYQSGDIVNGGAGNDVLNLTVVENNGSTKLVELNDVERINIRTVDGSGNYTIDASLWNGVQEIWNNKSLDYNQVINVQNGVVIGATNTDIELDISYDNDALGSANYEQRLVVENFGDEASPADLHIDYGGSDNISAFHIAATGSNFFEIGGGSITEIEKLTITGTGSVEISDHGSAFVASEIDLSGNSGGVTLESDNEDVVVTGGSGDDVITLSNGVALTNKAGINLGDGDDSLLNNGSAGIGTSAVLDGGAGVDTINSTLLQVGNAANIKNFEILDVAGETRTIDASLFTASNFQSLAVTGALGGNVSVNKLAGTEINVNVSASTGAAVLTAMLASSAGAADAVNIEFASDLGATVNAFTSSGIETVSIVSDADDTAAVNVLSNLTLNDNSLTSITISGATDFTLSDVDTNASATTATANVQSALSLIDASAATGDLTIAAGESDAIGATAFNTTYNGLTINTGSGDDSITIGAQGGVVNTGTGADSVVVNNSGVSVTFAADDNIDNVDIGAGAAFTTTNGAFTASSRITTIAGLDTGDTIDLSAINNTVATVNDFTATATTLASLEAAINAALADATAAADFFNWVDGNTYIIVDGAATSDAVVELVGVYDDFSAAAGVITFA